MSGAKFVFCEGKDDVSVIKCVAESIGIPDLRIEDVDGKANFRDFFKAVRSRPEFSQEKVASIGIVRDADNNGAAAFQSVRDALLANGFGAPDTLGGFIETPIKIGVFVIGPNDGRGMLEDLCLHSVRDRKEFECLEEYFRCIEEKSGRTGFSSKAKVRAWMASHPDHDLYVGKSAEKGYWPWESTVFGPLKEFLQRL